MRQPDFLHANNKDEDKPADLRSLVSTYVIHLLENVIAKLDSQALS